MRWVFSCKFHDVIVFNSWIVLHCVNEPHFLKSQLWGYSTDSRLFLLLSIKHHRQKCNLNQFHQWLSMKIFFACVDLRGQFPFSFFILLLPNVSFQGNMSDIFICWEVKYFTNVRVSNMGEHLSDTFLSVEFAFIISSALLIISSWYYILKFDYDLLTIQQGFLLSTHTPTR